jgi:hypothetical protein
VKPIDRDLLDHFLALAGERLAGDWVVIGGTVLPLLGAGHRVTIDIDIAGPEEAGMAETLALFGIAGELGLPPEAINQAATFFLHRVPGWRDRLVPVHQGSRARILVPDPTLFVLLKIGRLTEADLADCLAMLALAGRRGWAVDGEGLRQAVHGALREAASPGRTGRLRTLLETLAGT